MLTHKIWPSVRVTTATSRAAIRATASDYRVWAWQVALTVVNNGTLLILWLAIYWGTTSINGYALVDFLHLFAIIAIGTGVITFVCGRLYDIPAAVAAGELDGIRAEPGPVLSRLLVQRSDASGVGDVLSGLTMVAVAPPATWAGAVGFAMGALTSGVVYLGYVVTLSALSAGRSMSDPAILGAQALFSLAIFPGFAFPVGLRIILYTVVPTFFFAIAPSRLVDQPSILHGAAALLGAGVVLCAAGISWNRLLRRLEIVG